MAHRCGFEGCKAPGLIPLVEGRLYLCIAHVNKVLDSRKASGLWWRHSEEALSQNRR